MLGYVKPERCELKIKDYDIYRGYYCSLCKALGRNYGQLSRLFLSYDATFLTLFLFALNPESNVRFKKGRCPFNPFKKCGYTDIKTDEFDFASAFSVIVSFYKIKDNITDSNFFKRIPYYSVLPFVYFKYKKASKKFPEIERIVNNSIEEQKEIEKSNCDICDKAADASAKALGECFSLKAKEKESDLFYRFGYCLGKYVYLIDALDDLEKDKKNKSYNVFIINGYTYDQIAQVIRMSINELILCFDLIDFYDNKDILSNIIKNGLDKQLCFILNKKEGTVNE